MSEMEEMSELARSKGIAVASHDDDATDKIDFNETLATTISEFPITMEVAKYAHGKGMYTLAGAPNIMLGGSHSGNLNAKDAIMEGCISILCSDYYPPAMLHSVFKLHKRQIIHWWTVSNSSRLIQLRLFRWMMKSAQ